MSWMLILPIMFALMLLNMRIYLAMFTAIIIYFVFFSNVPMGIAVQRLVAPTQNSSLLAIPFFILLGTLLSHTGVAERILRLASLLVGRLRGGLAMANVMMSTLMGGVSASNLADAAMLSRMMVPEMERSGYNRAFAAAVTGCGSLVTPIIPPGIALIIYGMVADVSIGSMFMAGILPGLLCAVLLMLTIWLISVKRGYQPALKEWPKPREYGSALIHAWPAVFVLVGVVGGIRANIFTPTEAGAAAVLLVTFIGFVIYREMKVSHVASALVDTARSTAAVMLVIMASSALAWIFSLEQAGVAMADWITSLTDNKYVFLTLVNILLLTVGMFIEGTALIIVLVPLLKPVVLQLGIDPVHFGLVMILNLSIGTLTPPVGTVMLLVCNITNVKMNDFLKQGLPLFLALLVALMLVTYIPAISLALT
ncbi:C4-dicarboxylate ABC transporter [Lampropedia cohaerens]|uniref:TRAP transporter large permease protein n=1 Tax=Lampropedia cohaerens TaxID=1610491 RepID=A0A0U1PX10_9BURK|nr:TRAP transporter large permease [Lampropedia cohaerens]KKW67074.1 C4-dicarboxylate ABC transporter [Lampropedia cohaerens]